MRLHRGGRGLSCRHCGKAFIHNKRLQSHEASCRQPAPPGLAAGLPPLPIRPKEEPLEEGEVRIEGGVVVGADGVAASGKAAKKGRGLPTGHPRHAAEAESGELVVGEDDHHFVKVVDGHVIYFCAVCERSYMTLSSLKRHSNVHSWRRKYPCHFCDKVFALAEYRTKHEVWHTGERRYQCIFCWDAFATYYNLKTHQKAIHGISPGLISSEKTANGGYKQKVNALKLYRLLPMRSQKRPYKTYSDGAAAAMLADGLLPPPPGDPLAPPPDRAPPGNPPLSGGELRGGFMDAKTVKPDPDDFPDGFPVSVGPETPSAAAALTPPEASEENVRKMSAGGHKTKTPKGVGRGGAEPGVPSVIIYGHSKPSVIVHGTAVSSSSVIVHSNQVAKSPLGGPSPPLASQTGPAPPRAGAESQRKRSRDGGSDAAEEAESGRSPHKSRRSHSSSSAAAAAAKHSSSSSSSPGGGDGAKGAGPLCQITVRIGEEAIVKRSISETDLRRDKSPHLPKAKRAEQPSPSPDGAREARHAHHHHHHHHKHRGGGGGGGGEAKKKSPKHPGKVREYYFRQEVREQDDSDGEDNLWRPYYAYKPKRKSQAPLQKTRSWQRKMHHKRSLRLLRRAERLMDHVTKETDRRGEEEEEEEEERKTEKDEAERTEEEKDKTEDEERETPESPPATAAAAKGRDKEEAGGGGVARVKPGRPPPPPPASSTSSSSSPPPPKPSPSTPSPAAGVKRQRPWSNDNAAECGTCGRWFSSPRKRDKHELGHLLEFVCLHCHAPFPSRDKLEEHQRTQHPRASEPPAPPPPSKAACGEAGGAEPETVQEERESRTPAKAAAAATAAAATGPGRLSRRALARHTCPQCHKVCKTPSALTRHVRRHELSSSPEREEAEPETVAAAVETAAAAVGAVSSRDPDPVPLSQSIPVISYSTAEPVGVGGGENAEPERQRERPASEVRAEQQQTVISFPAAATRENPDEPDAPPPVPDTPPGPRIINPPPESPAKPRPPAAPPALKPARPEFSPLPPPSSTSSSSSSSSSALQGVLVMSGSECLDYRAPRKRGVDVSRLQRTPSPACCAAAVTTAASPNAATAPKARAPPNAPEKERPAVTSGVFLRTPGVYDDASAPFPRDLRVAPASRSPSPSEAQDLTMSSILAREWERERDAERERERRRERDREMERESLRERERERERQREREPEMESARAQPHSRGACPHHAPPPPSSSSSSSQDQSRDSEVVTLLVPKEEPVSPAPSPPRHAPAPTASSPRPPLPLPPQRRPAPKSSPRHSPTAADLLAQVNRHARGPDRLLLPSGGGGGERDRPSGHALLLPRAPPQQQQQQQPPSEPEDNDVRDPRRGQLEAGGYRVQDLPLPLIMQGAGGGGGGYRPGKKQEEGLLVSYPAGPLPFGPLGKMLPNGDLAKLAPFYPDPYQLIYGPQLLAYPYNLAALPMALNMMAPGGGGGGGDKVEPLPFLPALFNYAAAAGPYMGALPHPLVANPSLYNSGGGGGGKKQRDGGGGKP